LELTKYIIRGISVFPYIEMSLPYMNRLHQIKFVATYTNERKEYTLLVVTVAVVVMSTFSPMISHDTHPSPREYRGTSMAKEWAYGSTGMSVCQFSCG
jgi:hypothetical protein